MKILTINVIGIPSGSSYNLIDANVFQDYDAVVVDPENLDTLYGHGGVDYSNRENGILTSESGKILSAINNKRREQVNGLLQRGGIIACFLEPLKEYSYKWRYQGKDRSSSETNYDWLMTPWDINRELGEIKYARGRTIDYIDSGHPFLEYLNTKPSWSAYVDKDACEDWKVLASAFGTHVVALTKRVGLGHIVLLPSYYDHHNGELLERCIVKLLGDKGVTPQPGWAKAILVPAQEDAQKLGLSQTMNMILIGALAANTEILPITKDQIIEGLKVILPPKYVAINLQAFEKGFSYKL